MRELACGFGVEKGARPVAWRPRPRDGARGTGHGARANGPECRSWARRQGSMMIDVRRDLVGLSQVLIRVRRMQCRSRSVSMVRIAVIRPRNGVLQFGAWSTYVEVGEQLPVLRPQGAEQFLLPWPSGPPSSCPDAPPQEAQDGSGRHRCALIVPLETWRGSVKPEA